jgi:5-methylcytosine-specific restriction endonuclease McrA
MIQLMVRKGTYDKLQYARALLSHAVRSGDASDVLDRALDLLIAQVEKRKLGAGTRKSGLRRTRVRSRYVPAQVRRAVWERDQGQCTFVGSNGHRCGSKRFLEFDHVDPFARGGKATVEGMRLRCRAHNQFEAGRAFGVEFMNRKRREARLAAAEARDIRAGRLGVDVQRSGGGAGAVAAGEAEAWRLEAEQGTDVADGGLVGTSDERRLGLEPGDARAD